MIFAEIFSFTPEFAIVEMNSGLEYIGGEPDA